MGDFLLSPSPVKGRAGVGSLPKSVKGRAGVGSYHHKAGVGSLHLTNIVPAPSSVSNSIRIE